MFGCVVAGRPLQTNLQQVDETHAVFELSQASTINHICVFLLGTVPFPEGFGATVHFHWPGKGFQLLGALSNEKPSAIFRLRGTFSAHSSLAHTAFRSSGGMAVDDGSGGADIGDVTAVLGISVEPFDAIQAQLASLASSSSLGTTSGTGALAASVPDASFLAERIVKHLFNYLSGFATGGGGGLESQSVVQLGAVQRWYESFLAKLRAGGTGFLERLD